MQRNEEYAGDVEQQRNLKDAGTVSGTAKRGTQRSPLFGSQLGLGRAAFLDLLGLRIGNAIPIRVVVHIFVFDWFGPAGGLSLRLVLNSRRRGPLRKRRGR